MVINETLLASSLVHLRCHCSMNSHISLHIYLHILQLTRILHKKTTKKLLAISFIWTTIYNPIIQSSNVRLIWLNDVKEINNIYFNIKTFFGYIFINYSLSVPQQITLNVGFLIFLLWILNHCLGPFLTYGITFSTDSNL